MALSSHARIPLGLSLQTTQAPSTLARFVCTPLPVRCFCCGSRRLTCSNQSLTQRIRVSGRKLKIMDQEKLEMKSFGDMWTRDVWMHLSSNSKFPRSGSVSATAMLAGAGQGSIEMAAALFTFGTAFVVPFYTIMICAPHGEWTKKFVNSEIPYAVLGALYIYLLCLSWTPETLGLMFASKYWLPELPGVTRMFSSTMTVASAWLHWLAADLFAGRQIFLDGLEHNVETRHSLVLCLMMCPIGIFVHMVTKIPRQSKLVIFTAR